MSEATGWKIYDLGQNMHGLLLNDGKTRQERYFAVGIARTLRHWHPDYCHDRHVAERIVRWKNQWEDLRLAAQSDPQRSA